MINLLYSKEVGIDSESASAIHEFDKAQLEIIQIFDPVKNVVILFDVRDLKNDKKKKDSKSYNSQCDNKNSLENKEIS